MDTTLFDGDGHPVAYVADDEDNAIYLWSGHAVAYVNEERIFGWNGRHLGFLVNGVVSDAFGRRIGSTREQCWATTYAEPVKQAKHAKYERYERHEPSPRPSMGSGFTNMLLEDFLKQGAVVAV